MKKILVSLLVAAMVGATLTGCGSKPEGGNGSSVEQTSSVSAKDVVDKMTEEGYVRMPMEIDETQAKEMYHINMDDVENYGIAETGISPGPGLIVVVEEGYVRMPMEIDETQAKEMYHINMDDVENYGIAETGISPGPGLIVVVKAKDGKVDAVKEAVEQIKADKVGSAFYPDEKDVAEKATVEVNGNFVSLFLLNEEVAAEAENFYKDAIK